MKSLVALGLLLTNYSFAEGLTSGQVRQYLEDMKNSNTFIKSESMIVERRCTRQRTREKAIQSALGQFDSQVKELQGKIEKAEADQKPFEDALNKAKKDLADSTAEIASIQRKLLMLGRPDEQLAVLQKEKRAKTDEKASKQTAQRKLQDDFDKWEDAGDNGRILDEALKKMGEGTAFEKLSPIEQDVVRRHQDFRTKNEDLFEEIQGLEAQLLKIDKDIKDLADKKGQDKRTLEAKLGVEQTKQTDASKAIKTNKPEVDKFARAKAGFQASINRRSGFRKVPVSEYCDKLGIK